MKLVVPVERSSKHSSERVFFKIHRRDRTEILAICDEALLGKELTNNTTRMKVPIGFYKGRDISQSDALDLMRRYTNINALGSVLDLGIKKEIINEEAVIWFNSDDGRRIPHLLIFSFPPI
ncbi:hypothetical protein CEE45_00150 [Candidatus Heimdallarchaeota archaeon B3_Heim]|nr:MAG: hypothetical protein CEE45_00150 [Candidatus Heimdallarchaeota archaeon B3_Heim]